MKKSVFLCFVLFVTVKAFSQETIAVCNQILDESQGSNLTRVFPMPASAQERHFLFSFNAYEVPDYVNIEFDGLDLGTIWVGGDCNASTGNGSTLWTCLRGPVLWNYDLPNQINTIKTFGQLQAEDLLDGFGYPKDYSYSLSGATYGSLVIDLILPAGPCQELKFSFVSNPNQSTDWNGLLDCNSSACPEQNEFDLLAQVQEESVSCGTSISVCGATFTRWTLPNGEVIQNNGFVAQDSGTYYLEVDFLSCPSIQGEVEIDATNNQEIPFTGNIVSNSPVCNDGELHLSANNLESLPGDIFYKWTGPGNINETAAYPIIENFNQSNIGTYHLTVYNSEGCFMQSEFNVDMVQQIAHSSVEGQACEGGEIALHAQAELGFNNETYQWTGLNNFSSNEASLVIDPSSPEAAGVYSITIKDHFGCAYTRQHTIENYDLSLQTSSDDTSPCINNGIASVTIAGGQGPYDILWTHSTDEDLEFDPTQSEISQLPMGLYSVEVTDINGCIERSQAWVLEDELRLEVSAPRVCDPLEEPYYQKFLIDQNTEEVVYYDDSQVLHDNPGIHSIGLEFEGCTYEADYNLYAWRNQKLYIPTAFSPNYDGINDKFKILNDSRPDIIIDQFTIYHRWGGQVFSEIDTTLGTHNGWNGKGKDNKPVAQGTYIYLLKYRMAEHCEVKEAKGEVNVLR